MEDIWGLYIWSAIGCVIVAITFFATVQPWQPKDRRYELYNWKFWWKIVSIDDVPREGEHNGKEAIPRELLFPGLLLGLLIGFVIVGTSTVLFRSYPSLLYIFWVIGFLTGPIMGNLIAYGALRFRRNKFIEYEKLALRRHFFGWCYVILLNSLLGLEKILDISYLSRLFDHFPDKFMEGPAEKIIMVGVVLFCWRAASRGFENWKPDIREVRKESGLGPIPPEWTPHIAMNDLFSALSAILIVILYV